MRKIISILLIASLLIPVSSASFLDNIFEVLNPVSTSPTKTITKDERWNELYEQIKLANTETNIKKLQNTLSYYNYPPSSAFAIYVTDLDKRFVVSYKSGLGVSTVTEITHKIYLTESEVQKILSVISTDTDTETFSMWTRIQLWYILKN